ncbi:adenylate/guanylate cyclase domain-containing protein [Granulosicoccus sp. 3-233]|uniref:adenylate/guanylate cyclase domain-containing protein n=1 Tax=Granulosicoccus sp. 3-233 TaxID=3417969 RepID=UPI003D33CA0A
MPDNSYRSAARSLLDSFRSKHVWFFSGREYAALPESLRTAIEEQQHGSERLISWIQLSILLVFATLYAAAPNTLPVDGKFEPVPIFLSAWCLFACARLYLTYKIRLNYPLLVISVLVDMALLMGLIWSFHLQYMQPPSFYLKSPTLLYVFIFIALRALRFEPGFVLISGIVAALGWSLLVLLAVIAESPQTIVTRDYVVYLTSNQVLIGGELDKIISILMVTIILTLAVARGRRLLIQAIVEGRTAESLSLFVPQGVAEQITKTSGPLIDAQTETREASILFVDLVSFTNLAERLPPETLISTLNEFFSLISEPIERNHGVINQFQGDAILASFNLPTRDLHHATHAVRAAIEIQELLQRHRFTGGITLSIRAGVNTGTIVGGFIGTADRLSYTVYGDDVNIAARLQQLGKQYDANNLISSRTRQLCDPKIFRFTRKGSEILRGRSKPVKIYEARKRHP